ncbi:uncharacterized protein B0J16DRAFT_253283, partial [Fusarium flagelliforme]|uniref:uncharacterized protein n=1 Tax=Fusarium flagelliforme TaxID=2675880 RepID=UPI001E8DC64A
GALQAAREVLQGSPVQLNPTKSKEWSLEDLQLQERALTALQDLPKQHSLLLLRGSIQLLLRHLQRQLCPIGLDDLWGEADTLIKEAILAIVARTPTLPTREGGLGIPLHKELAAQLYQAAIRASQPTLAKIRATATGDPPPIAPIATEGPTAKEVLITANKARLETFLQDLPTLYQQARLENASYLG